MRPVLRSVLSILLVLAVGCPSVSAPAKKRTLSEPLVAANLPPTPEEEAPVPGSADWAVGIEAYIIKVEDGTEDGALETVRRPGICMSTEKAVRAAKYVIRYKEMRGLYTIDLRTWGRERGIYEGHLEMSQDEVDAWKKKAERSWFEQHSGQIGLIGGLVIGVVVSAVAVSAINGAAE